MNISVALLTFFALLMPISGYAEDSCSHGKDSFHCVKYVRNYDADTITFDIAGVHPFFGEKMSVRVSGVDTPEIKTKNKCEKEKARHAKKLVENLLKKAKRIDLKNVEKGKYFRIVADVVIDGKSLSEYLLKNGLAYSYAGGTKKKIDWCRSHRDIASDNK